MLHLDEVFTAEIYARGGIVVGRCQRGKEVVKPWVSRGVSFGTFLSLMKEKYEHLRKTKKDTIPKDGVLLELRTDGYLQRRKPPSLHGGARGGGYDPSHLINPQAKKDTIPKDGVLFGACGRIRTGDLLITSELLCQLSHTSMIKAA